MSIKTGRYGRVAWDTDGSFSPLDPTTLISINSWKLTQKRKYTDVTCFGDTNIVYIPGLRDVQGTLTGFWNSSSTLLFDAASQDTPGFLQLAPNTQEPTFLFFGQAFMDADIDCSLEAPKLTGTFMAAGPWTVP